MKRITFTVDLDVEDDDYDDYASPQQLARAAMTYGDMHQPWTMSLALGSDISVQTLEET